MIKEDCRGLINRFSSSQSIANETDEEEGILTCLFLQTIYFLFSFIHSMFLIIEIPATAVSST